MSIREDAAGHWLEILVHVGIDRSFLKNQHGPCPICGGKDRFRWDNRDNKGGFICNQCGSGDGFKLAELFGVGFRQVCEIIRGLSLSTDRASTNLDNIQAERRQKEQMVALWSRTIPLQRGSATDKYLARRMGLFLDLDNVRCVRQARRVWHPFDNVHYPFAMVAKVVSEGRAVNLHITYLDDDGVRIQTKKPKLVMAGRLPPGCAIPLAPVTDHIGIAEGIETALACTILTGVPTWAAVNATVLSQWSAPEGVKKVTVFGDNDMSYTGQAKAYCLANRLVLKGNLSVTVKLPETDGADWADIVLAGAR